MPGPRFFLSYAGDDHDLTNTVDKFYERLTDAVRAKGGIGPSEDVGFLDHSEIGLGDRWPARLAEVLRTCQAMVCLYSPFYFRSEYCGKELAIFRARVDRFTIEHGLQTPPRLIFPVFLEKLLDPMPDRLADIQYDNASYPDQYRQVRLRQLMQVKAYRDHVTKLISKLAEDIIENTRQHLLPPLGDPPDLDSVGSIFHSGAETPARPINPVPVHARPRPRGPQFVRFFFVAATADELRAQGRREVDAYGVNRGMDWQPYFPPVRRSASFLAQDIATALNMVSIPEPLNGVTIDAFIGQLHQAEADGNVVILVVDTWTIAVEKYLQLMAHYDRVDLWNSAVLVVWNGEDDETREALGRLQQRVRHVFLTKRTRNDSYVYRESGSAEEFRVGLSETLAKIQLKVVAIAKELMPAEGERFVPKPHINAVSTGKVL